jgi:hypothetical protein
MVTVRRCDFTLGNVAISPFRAKWKCPITAFRLGRCTLGQRREWIRYIVAAVIALFLVWWMPRLYVF